ncbi:unnamed protein product [Meganyctiphanes norvegica]|uniref:Longitudinals lacking protein n=1 Tax=Meganyctiphanes norvegica TaxID=48144 RepID=A0AAV2RUA1_MEGNR
MLKMDGQLLSLKWENHKNSFYQALTSIRKNYSYYDVTIVCGHKTYKAHKLVLSTCSEFLEEVLERTKLTTPLPTHPVIVLHDIQSHYLEALLDYMYVGEVDVLQTDLPGLIKAAELLKVKGLAVSDAEPSNDFKGKKRYSEEQNQDRKKNRAVGKIDEDKNKDHITEKEVDENALKGMVINVKKEVNYSTSFTDTDTFHEQSDSSVSCSNVLNFEENKNSEPVQKPSNHESCMIKEENQIGYTEELFMEEHADNNEYYSHEFENSSGQESIDPELDFITQGYSDDHSSTTFTGTTNTFSQQSTETFEEENQDIMNISYVDGLASDIQQNPPPMDGNEVWIRSGRGGSGRGVACPYCMKVFTRKSIFIYHYKTHTGEKPFGCPHCPRRFIQKGNMESHARTHIKEKSSKCPHCPQIFTQRVYLMMHINEAHMQQTMS